MRQTAAFALALALGLTAALGLVSCGGGEDAKLLPGNTAREISENLDTVEQLANEGECVGAANTALEVNTQVESLEGVDAQLKQALQRGATRLNEVVSSCEETTTEAVAPADEAPSTEETEVPPGQEKKAEKEQQKEEKERSKEEEATPPDTPTTPTETTPETPSTTTPVPPSEGGGTGAPGGVAPGAPAAPGGE
jgi:outer membrane biosynthesis protein TonB